MDNKMKYIQYEHHGKTVWVREDLKGTHRDHCLCFSCDKFNINDREKNCPIANELFQFSIKHNTTNPIFECPNFGDKNA
jgi:hypothetical protein